MPNGEVTAKQEWGRHWPLVLASTIGFSFHSVVVFSAGLFIEPLGTEFGWSRAQASVGLTLAALTTTLLSPFAGAMIDRFGTRRLAIPGIFFSALVIASFSLANGSTAQWLMLWSFYALIGLAIKTTVWTAAISGSFDKGRSMALAVTLCGTGIAQMLAPPIARWLIADYGWRTAYVSLGLGWGAIALVLALLFFSDAFERNRDRNRKVATAAHPAAEAPAQVALRGLTIPEALRSVPLYRIGATTLIMMSLTIAVIVHQVPILSEAGVSRENAAYLASVSGLAGIGGKLLTGWMMNRFHAGWVSGLTIMAASAGFLILLETFRTPTTIVLAMVIIGYVAGAILQVGAYLTSIYAGLLNFGKIYGTIASLVALGAGIGPVAAGLIYDQTGSYTLLLLMGIGGSILAGLLVIGLGGARDEISHNRLSEMAPG